MITVFRRMQNLTSSYTAEIALNKEDFTYELSRNAMLFNKCFDEQLMDKK